jgi:hypothetical protein
VTPAPPNEFKKNPCKYLIFALNNPRLAFIAQVPPLD